MADKIGDDFKLYRDTADSWASPTWSEVTQADDLGLDHGPNGVAIQKRGRDITYKQGKKDQKLSTSVVYDSADAHVTEFEAHLDDGGDMHMAIADGNIATSGTSYWHAEMVLIGFSEGLNIGDAAKYDLELGVSANTTNDPARATIA